MREKDNLSAWKMLKEGKPSVRKEFATREAEEQNAINDQFFGETIESPYNRDIIVCLVVAVLEFIAIVVSLVLCITGYDVAAVILLTIMWPLAALALISGIRKKKVYLVISGVIPAIIFLVALIILICRIIARI